jgi:hypothetical protein
MDKVTDTTNGTSRRRFRHNSTGLPKRVPTSIYIAERRLICAFVSVAA